MRIPTLSPWRTRGPLRGQTGAALALAAVLAGCAGEVPWRTANPARWSQGSAAPPPAGKAAEAHAPEKLAERKLRFLELAWRGMSRMRRRIQLDEERLSSGSLSASALAAAGRLPRQEAARWVRDTLEACDGRWSTVGCERVQLLLQRVALQYSWILPPGLAGRLRTETAVWASPPGPEAIRNPWVFKETENQRMVKIARSLGGLKLAGEAAPGSPRAAALEAWGAYAEAFLLAHDRDGWYEAESPGYIGQSMSALFHLVDHAPQESVRRLAARQLDLLFADWAQEQVDGFPAGAKSRTYVHWALGAGNTRWPAWAWLAIGLGNAEEISFRDCPEIATTTYEIPAPVRRLLAERKDQPPYEIRTRRHIRPGERMDLDTALYSYATPDYILGTAQTAGGLRLSVSGGQEIMATLFASAPEFAPLYLWSRISNPRADRWKSFAGRDLAFGHRNVALTRLGVGAIENGEGTGHAYLSRPWARPEPAGDSGEVVVSRCGDTYVALITEGGWEVAPAPERFPGYYGGDGAYRGSWAAVPRRQPAAIVLEAGRHAEDGGFEQWKKKVAAARLAVVEGELRFTASDGTRLAFLPGQRARLGDEALDLDYPRLSGPFLSSPGEGRWTFSFGGHKVMYEPLSPRPAP